MRQQAWSTDGPFRVGVRLHHEVLTPDENHSTAPEIGVGLNGVLMELLRTI
jgi:hypothetical protein